MRIPPDVSQGDYTAATAEFERIVGGESVFTTTKIWPRHLRGGRTA